MKILRYEKKKNGMYQVFFDNGNNFDIHEEIILKYEMLLKKEFTNKEIDELLDENKIYVYYDLAIKYIAKKMRSKKEIREYLKDKEADNDTINKVIEILSKQKYIDDEMYAKSYVNDRMLLSMDGPLKIRNKLEESWIDEKYITSALQIFGEEEEKERIEKIINKKIASNRNKSNYVLKNKIIEYLYTLGYSKSLSQEIINSVDFKEDKDIIKKEYEKIYKKLSKKYDGKDLEYRVKQKMYQMGFGNYNE